MIVETIELNEKERAVLDVLLSKVNGYDGSLFNIFENIRLKLKNVNSKYFDRIDDAIEPGTIHCPVTNLVKDLELLDKRLVGISGHRPPKLGLNYSIDSHKLLTSFCLNLLKHTSINDVVYMTGMALGFDMALADACYQLKCPFVAVIPFDKQESYYQFWAVERYKLLLQNALKVVDVQKELNLKDLQPSEYYKARNKYIVDNSEVLCVLYNESEEASGTGFTHRYAQRQKKSTRNLWEDWNLYLNEQSNAE